MGMWDDWKDNITKAFRYVPMADTAMDVYDFLSGKTPDQIADEKTRAMTENDELRITVYYNKDDETVTQGDCIYEFSSSRKKMSIYQLEL